MLYSPADRKSENTGGGSVEVHTALTPLKPWIFFAAHRRLSVNGNISCSLQVLILRSHYIFLKCGICILKLSMMSELERYHDRVNPVWVLSMNLLRISRKVICACRPFY